MRDLALCLAAVLPLFCAQTAGLARARELYQRTDYRAALAALAPEKSTGAAAWHLAGRAWFQLGDYPKAQEWLQKAAAAEPARSEHFHWLGKAFGRRAETSSFLTAPKYASDCRKAFEKAVEVDPKNVEAWNDLLEYYLAAPGFLGGGLDKAAHAAERIGQLDPVEKHFAAAKLAEKKEDWTAAEQHWRSAAELAPKQSGRWADLAKFFARRQRFSESDQAFERAAQAEPAAASVGFARAETNIESKRNLAEARKVLTAYLAAANLTPDDPSKDDARKLLKKLP